MAASTVQGKKAEVAAEMTKAATAAGMSKIEVTDEMLEAGLSRYYGYDPRIYDIHEVLPEVFKAMFCVSKSASAR